MKTSHLLLLGSLFLAASFTHAQTTAFTYQGRLDSGGLPVNGSYDLRFTIQAAASGPAQIGPALTNATRITNGLFTVVLDFGAGVFNGTNRWMEIAVRTNGAAAFTTMAPRQALTPAPTALYALGSGGVADGSVSSTQLNTANAPSSGQVLAFNSGGALVWTNATAAAGAWSLNGNAGNTGAQFIGTTDNQPVEIKVNGTRVARFQPGGGGAHSVVLGYAANSLPGTAMGSTISGGYGNVIRTNSDYSVIAGGNGHVIQTNADAAVISGGNGNLIGSDSHNSVVAGGYDNAILNGAQASTISGGINNRIHPSTYSATIGGGTMNTISTNAGSATIAGGSYNLISDFASSAAIAGGRGNTIGYLGNYAAISGGMSNAISSWTVYSAIGGGIQNTIDQSSENGVVSGGRANRIGSGIISAVIGGGGTNSIGNGADCAVIAGGQRNVIQANAECSVISGGYGNIVQPNVFHSSIVGGSGNTIQTMASKSIIGGGSGNTIQGYAYNATIGGGDANTVQTHANDATIPGGVHNLIQMESFCATIGGGYYNTIYSNADYAIIPGGKWNAATNLAFAAGYRAKANHRGAFVWGDSADANIASATSNSVTMRASGGYRLFSDASATVGASLAAGSGTWTSMSDRNAKEAFQPVDPQEVLDKVTALPLTTWKYKAQDAGVRHMGPMAQDFKAAFAIGESETGITTIDADGVALAAIQGLNQKLEEAVRAKDNRIAELEQRLTVLEQLIQSKAR